MQVSEEWRDIPGYEGLYQVSSLGRVKSLNGYHRHEHYLKPKYTKDGYFEYTLTKNSIPKCIRGHRLVAMAFIPNEYNKPQINHINCIKVDNRVENLEWCTNQENINHAIENKLEVLEGHFNPNAKKVYQYDVFGNLLKEYECIKYASIKNNIKQNNISRVCNGHQKTAGGYVWKFEREVM